MKKRLEEYQTSDLGCAAALISAGFELVSLDKDRTNPRKVLFNFCGLIGIEETANDYWADKLQVKARIYFDNVKMLKNRIHNQPHSLSQVIRI